MRVAWQIHNLCRMEKQEPTPFKKLIRAFFWGNELKAFPLLKSAIFAFPHERHLKPTTATTTWNSKQKPKSAIFCFFSHSFSRKERTHGSSRYAYRSVYQQLSMCFNYNSHLFSSFWVHPLQSPSLRHKNSVGKGMQKMFLSLREISFC